MNTCMLKYQLKVKEQIIVWWKLFINMFPLRKNLVKKHANVLSVSDMILYWKIFSSKYQET